MPVCAVLLKLRPDYGFWYAKHASRQSFTLIVLVSGFDRHAGLAFGIFGVTSHSGSDAY
jgi:hypothetical protein